MEDPDLARRVEAAVTVAARGRGEGGQLHPKTRKRHARAWAEADAWLRAEHWSLVAKPWTSETLALYAVVLLERGYAKSTTDGRLSAIRAGHRLRGWPVPDGVAAWYVLRGANDSARGRGKVVAALMVGLDDEIFVINSGGTVIRSALRFQPVMSLKWAPGLRESPSSGSTRSTWGPGSRPAPSGTAIQG